MNPMSQNFNHQNPSSSRRHEMGQGDFIQNQFQNANFSPAMFDLGIRAGGEIISNTHAKWMPGVSDFWSSLRIYFAVSNNYVMKKILIVLYPMRNQAWGRVLADEAAEVPNEVEMRRRDSGFMNYFKLTLILQFE